jgi:hypothetical protein
MKDWKTTLMGVLAGALMVTGGAMNNRANDPTAPPVTAGNILPAVAVAILGALAKDANNGGNPPQS